MVSEGEEVGNLWRRAGGMIFLFWLLAFGGGGGGGGRFFYLLVLFVFCLVGWLVGWGGFLSWCLAQGRYFSCINFLLSCRMWICFFLFLFFSLFFLVELEGWLDYASPGRAD